MSYRIFLSIIMAIILLAGPFCGCGKVSKDITYTTDSNEARALFLEGVEKTDNFYFDEARALFGRVIELDPEFAMGYYYWAVTSTTTDDFQARLARAAELADNASEPERLVILSLKAQNDDSTGRARELLERLVEILPESKRAHFFLGIFYFGQQEWDLAEKEIKTVTKLDPDFAPAYNMLGYVYVNTNNYPEAIQALKRYSELRPEDPNPHDSMAEIYLAMGDHENSIKHYKLALKLESDYVASIAGLGHNYTFMNEYDKARQNYADIFRNAQSTADTNTAYLWMTISYLHEGNYDKAIEIQNGQLEHAKNLTDIYVQALVHGRLAAIYREKGDFKKALQECEYEREISERPDMQPGVREGYVRDYLFTEAIVLTRMGKRKQADEKLEQFKQSASASKNSIVLKTYRGLEGVVAYWNKDYENAIRHLKETNPLNQYFKYYLGLCYLKTGEEEEAHEIFSDIATYNRNSLPYSFVRSAAAKLI